MLADGVTGTCAAQYDFGPFGRFTTILGGGTQSFFDFVNAGDPSNPGFPFTLGANSFGFIDVDIQSAGSTGSLAYAYTAQLADGGTVTGTVGMPVAATPEPATLALVLPGAAAVFAIRRRGSKRT